MRVLVSLSELSYFIYGSLVQLALVSVSVAVLVVVVVVVAVAVAVAAFDRILLH